MKPNELANLTINDLQEVLDRELYLFFEELDTARKVDSDHLGRIKAIVFDICYKGKGVDRLPKKLLATMYSIARMIQSEIPNFQGEDASQLEQAMSDIDFAFYLTLSDEVPSDREPGKLRIW